MMNPKVCAHVKCIIICGKCCLLSAPLTSCPLIFSADSIFGGGLFLFNFSKLLICLLSDNCCLGFLPFSLFDFFVLLLNMMEGVLA